MRASSKKDTSLQKELDELLDEILYPLGCSGFEAGEKDETGLLTYCKKCEWEKSEHDTKAGQKKELKKFIKKVEIDAVRGMLLDQLYRFEGILGKYNCQHGGTKCNFQTNCHRLIRAEIDKLKSNVEEESERT